MHFLDFLFATPPNLGARISLFQFVYLYEIVFMYLYVGIKLNLYFVLPQSKVWVSNCVYLFVCLYACLHCFVFVFGKITKYIFVIMCFNLYFSCENYHRCWFQMPAFVSVYLCICVCVYFCLVLARAPTGSGYSGQGGQIHRRV